MKLSKYILILLATFLANSIFAQTTTITQLLQKTLQQENKARQMVHAAGRREGAGEAEQHHLAAREDHVGRDFLRPLRSGDGDVHDRKRVAGLDGHGIILSWQ